MREDNSLRWPLLIGAVLVGGFILIFGVYALFQTEGGGTDDPAREPDPAGNRAPGLQPGLPAPGAGQGGADTIEASCQDATRRISWADAEQNLNQRIAVVGPVLEVVGDVEEIRLGQEVGDEQPITLTFAGEAADNVPFEAGELTNATVCAIGLVQQDGDRLTMVINEPADIVII